MRRIATQAAALETAWKRVWPDDPKRPILHALRRAYIKRLTSLVADVRKGTLPASLVQELKQIGEWIYEPADKNLPIDDPRTHIFGLRDGRIGVSVGPPHLSEILNAAGVRPEFAERIIQALSESLRRRGAPIKSGTRALAIKALEKKHRSGSKFNLRQFVNKESARDISRLESVRQALIKLNHLLNRVAV